MIQIPDYAPSSALDTDDHDTVIDAKVGIVPPVRNNPDIDGVVVHLVMRANDYHLSLRPIRWTWTHDGPIEAYLLFVSVLMDSAGTALVHLALNDVLLPTVHMQRSIAEYFIRSAYYDRNVDEIRQAFDHYALTNYEAVKLDPRSNPEDLQKARAFYEEVKKHNPNCGARDTTLKRMMREVAEDTTDLLYTLFYGAPSEIVHGTVGGLYQIVETSDGAFAANIRRSPQEVNADMLATVRCLINFGDIMAKRFGSTSHVNRGLARGTITQARTKARACLKSVWAMTLWK